MRLYTSFQLWRISANTDEVKFLGA